MTHQDIIMRFLAGFHQPERLPGALALLSNTYQFTNPIISLRSQAEFILLAQQISKVITGIEILNISASDSWVVVKYHFKSDLPGLASTLATEWFRIENQLIMESHLIYDASHWRKVYDTLEEAC